MMSSRCQDCGNQAKKDCGYMRCRSCCRNRGFQCQTHVKSTWVPVSTRRPRLHHQLLPANSTSHQHQDFPNPKRYRHLHDASSSSSAAAHHFNLGFEGGGEFPAEVSFPATFRGVRVSSNDNAVDQYAYQTSVNIGGHIFKGIIYDQGPAPAAPQESPSSVGGIFQQPNLFTPTSYPNCPINLGTQFFPYPKS